MKSELMMTAMAELMGNLGVSDTTLRITAAASDMPDLGHIMDAISPWGRSRGYGRGYAERIDPYSRKHAKYRNGRQRFKHR